MPKKIKAKKFNYAVGFYWPDGEGSVGCYAHGSETFFGTLEDAQNFRRYAQSQTDKKSKVEYKIFQLVEMPE